MVKIKMKNSKTITKIVFSVLALMYLAISGLPSHADHTHSNTNLGQKTR